MPIEIKIPAVGESITEVQISEWLKAEGDIVKQDETIAIIDSEKTTLDLPAPQSGRLTKILHKAGETIAIGTVVAQLESETEKAQPAKAEMAPAKSEPKSAAPAKDKTEKPAPAAPTKAVKAKAEAPPEKTEEEAEPAPAPEIKTPERKPAAPAAPSSSSDREEEVVPMTMLRRTVARHLVEAQQSMAMLTTFNEVDMSALLALRNDYKESFEKRHAVRLGFMSFFVKATIDALKQFPQLNAEIRGNDIIYRNYFDIGVAIATDRGLVVPPVRNAERLSFAELEKAIGDFAKRAKEGKLKPADLTGGTFTVTNGGAFGSLLSTPIINPPQTGILGMHSIQERPVAVNGQVVIRPMMYVALTYDHRLVDGREAVLFLRRVKEAIETPARMLIEI